jgi:hypothetical protein
MKRSDLPFGSEFSPSQISLPRVLEMASEHGGDWKAFESAVRREYFESHETSDYNRGKLANNTKLGMIAYGLIDRDANLTELGRSLYAIRENQQALYKELARHILLNLHGMNLVQCVLDMQAAGETVGLVQLRRWLEERGVHFPRGGKHPSMMRLWLEKGGVFSSGWSVNEIRLRDVLGASTEEVEILAKLTLEQRVYLKTLANMGGPGPYLSNDVEKLASATYGISFNEKNLPKQVLYPLEHAGYVTLTRGTKALGRGAKPFMVSPTNKLVADLIAPLLEQLEKQTQSDLRSLLRKPLPEILKEMKSGDKHVRGLALEALAFKLVRLLDMTYVATRLRGIATGGAEVDVIFESSRLVFSRWQIQCKNTNRITLDDVAREVGRAYFLNTNVIVTATPGCIDPQVRGYVEVTERVRPLRFILLDGKALDRISHNPPSLVDEILAQAQLALCRVDQFSFLMLKRHPNTPTSQFAMDIAV